MLAENDYRPRTAEPPRRAVSQAATSVYLPTLVRNSNFIEVVAPFGVQMPDLIDANLTAVQQMGTTWVRVGLSWSDVEPSNTSPENFNWGVYDAGFAAAAERGLAPVVTITGNPAWAAATTCGPVYAERMQEFASFLFSTVLRYSRPPYNVRYWELYNEPDNADPVRSWLGGCWGGKGKEYGEMLRLAYPTIKAADPQAKVVLGSLAHDWFTTEGGPFDAGFLDDVLDIGKGNAGAFFDLLGFHYYPAFRLRWESYGNEVIGKTTFFRNKLSAYALNKPIVVTEISMWSGAGQGSSEDLQSDYVPQAFARAIAADLKFFIWFTLTDYNDWEYGLLRKDSSKKPAYTAYTAAANQLRGSSYKGPFLLGGIRPNNTEGYTFTSLSGKERHVIWATEQGSTLLTFPASRVVSTDKYGNATELTDGSDGNWDGKLIVTVTKSPIYLDVTPYAGG